MTRPSPWLWQSCLEAGDVGGGGEGGVGGRGV